MWFGTSAGLSEWNSADFQNYYKAKGLPSNYIKDICEDKNHLLFVATKNGLVFRNGKKFIVPSGLPKELHSEINRIYKTRNGRFFILTEENGVWEKRDEKFLQIPNENSDKKIIPISIVERQSGEILIGTRKNGIFQVLNNSLKLKIFQAIYKKFPVIDLVELNKDTLYIGMQGLGIAILSKSGKRGHTFITTKTKLPGKIVNSLALENKKDLYVATSNGIAIIRNGRVVKILTSKSGLSNEFVTNIFSPQKGLVFILTEGNGVFVYRPDAFVTYNKSSGLLHDNIWDIKELHDGSFLFATDEGVSIIKGNKISAITKETGLGDNLVLSIFESKNNSIYLSTYMDGVNVFENGKVKRLYKKPGMINKSVWSILELDNGNLLFITHKDGIALFDGNRVIDTLGIKNGLPHNKIASSLKMQDGTILVGMENNGVYKLAEDRFIKFNKELDSSFVWDMYEDESHNLFFGTDENGIIRLSADGKFDTVNVENGLSNNSVIGIVEDNLGYIYAATDRGLNVIKYLKNGKFKIRGIYKQSGLASNECNQGAIYKDSHGYIWVGTIAGATRINPRVIDESEEMPKVSLTSINIADKDFFDSDSIENIVLDYIQNDISFNFAGLNYSDPENVKFRYKLLPTDEDWIISTNNKINYANLSPDNYSFVVSSSNAWGSWSTPISFEFQINPPFWQTWWFYLAVIVLIILLIYAGFNYRLKHILRLEKLRSKISADLHDEIGSGLSEISILSELLKFNLKNEDELVKGLEHIGNSTRSLIEKLSDIIWIVNPQKESLKSLILRIQDNYQEVLYHSDISLNIINLELLENIILPLEIKQNLYLLSKEAINNSLKYSNCNNIDFEVKKRESMFCIEISDDGDGFDENKIQHGNGLFNMRKRADKIKANITIDSKINEGTKIRLEVFLKKFLRRNYD